MTTRGRRMWIFWVVAAGIVAILSSAMAPTAMAEGWHDRHGDFRHFNDRDLHVWSGGHWVHDRHNGRLGWWWVVGGGWYFYPAPVYPYPNPYVPPVVAAPPAPDASPQYWYYCASSRAYYPYVTSCPGGWMQVVPQAAPPQ